MTVLCVVGTVLRQSRGQKDLVVETGQKPYLAGGVKGTETSSHPHGRDLLVEDEFLHLRRQLMRMPMREK